MIFGAESFWQGVDIPGETLSNVIIVRLPFSVPDHPLLEARLEEIQRRGGNRFLDYQVPEAIIRLKQGFGRLIRSTRRPGHRGDSRPPRSDQALRPAVSGLAAALPPGSRDPGARSSRMRVQRNRARRRGRALSAFPFARPFTMTLNRREWLAGVAGAIACRLDPGRRALPCPARAFTLEAASLARLQPALVLQRRQQGAISRRRLRGRR